MLQVSRFAVENMTYGCVTDSTNPKFSWQVISDKSGVTIAKAVITMDHWTRDAMAQAAVRYDGPALKPGTCYQAMLMVESADGEKANASVEFETGKLQEGWSGKWITDGSFVFKEKKVSPVPMIFRKRFAKDKAVKAAKMYATALGIYEMYLNGEKVGDRYFAPGFTSYKTYLQYQTYDVTDMLRENNELCVTVAGGWAVGSFVFTRVNRVTADRQAFLAELHLTYEDGTTEVIGTDETWEVSEDGPFCMVDLYDGETYDATKNPAYDLKGISWKTASREKLRVNPQIIADYSAPVKKQESFTPISTTKREDGSFILDFGQNFAGVVCLNIRNAKKGQRIRVKHAEILNPDGSLNLTFLRTAKAEVIYTCKEGPQEYMPSMSYMGFRYAQIWGIAPEEVEVTACALYSDLERTGDFTCSNEMINRLQSNILWGSRSNFVDIPTDCPQRDERMGWTGDIAVFSPTACFNFDMSRFLTKWLKDVKAEQLPTGGIPNTVPVQGYGFPATMPKMCIDWWGDACVLVPWAEYQARGDLQILRDMYPVMKKYVNACKWWAGLFSFGKKAYIWNTPGAIHFGDWVAPDVPKMSQWQGRAKWTATASLCNTSALTAKVAEILGEKEEAKHFREISEKTADAYISVFTDGKSKLLEEFQTGYVLPLYMDMFPNREAKRGAAENLASLVKKNNYCIGTGFPGTPYILFALADNGQEETAFRMLTNTICPSWLYEVKAGATTIWERWDGLDENGVCPIGDDGTDIMISYNHYASGAVGAFLYQRVAGIEATEAGYKKFRVKPILGGALTWAKAHVDTPYGRIESDWKLENDKFFLELKVPIGTECELVLPDGSSRTVLNGTWSYMCQI